MSEKDQLITRDWLAIERTKLANERTFLAYFRTAVVFIGTGVGIMKMEFFSEIYHLGVISATASPIILLIGLLRLIQVKKTIKEHYKTTE